jgi:Tfp pilus assembly protein PilN
MINLLSPQEKKELREEKKLKLITILGILLLALAISFCLILFAIKIIISSQIETQKMILQQAESEFQISQIKDFREIIVDSNKAISELNSFYKGQFNFSDIVRKISDMLPPEIYLTNIFLNSQTDQGGEKILTCNLSGFSPSRDALLQFRNNLEKEEIFKGIYFPQSNWILPENISFSASFEINQ